LGQNYETGMRKSEREREKKEKKEKNLEKFKLKG
jgi:hypothetical protein